MSKSAQKQKIVLFDTTLRDGAQTAGVDFSPTDKVALATILDNFGIPYVEAGWPGANDTDNIFFANPPQFTHSRLVAFGMTKRVGISASNDSVLSAVLDSPAPAVCLVAKSWDIHVTTALNTTLEENLKSIRDSVIRARQKGKDEVMIDMEHFFDGYKNNKEYALACLTAARDAGANRLVLCDTNGGAFSHEVDEIVRDVIDAGFPGDMLGIHTHDDMDLAVANTIVAVRAGVTMVQGTLNGLGERAGNANLITLIPMLKKLGYDCGVSDEQMLGLRNLSLALDDILDRTPDDRAPFVGGRSFTHKGGLHASAVIKDPKLYEHIDPVSVGNLRTIPMSDQAGLANLAARLEEYGIAFDKKDDRLKNVIAMIKQRESMGYSYDLADASFELLLRSQLMGIPDYFLIENIRPSADIKRAIEGERAHGHFKRLSGSTSEATIKIIVGEKRHIRTAEGKGPVNAIDNALRLELEDKYPILKDMRLTDFKVRIINSKAATESRTAVRITSTAPINGVDTTWTTISVSDNVMKAAAEALLDAYEWYLLKTNTQAIEPNVNLVRDRSAQVVTIGKQLR